jgi:hypothetical protein
MSKSSFLLQATAASRKGGSSSSIFWLQNPKGEICDAATDAMAAGRDEKIDVVLIKLAIARLTRGRKRHGFSPLLPKVTCLLTELTEEAVTKHVLEFFEKLASEPSDAGSLPTINARPTRLSRAPSAQPNRNEQPTARSLTGKQWQ